MELLAQIAGGIAPALSDLLTVIKGQTGKLLDEADHEGVMHETLTQVYTAAEKASSLMRQLLIFSRQQTPNLVRMDFNRLINETVGVLHRLVGEKITLELWLTPGLPHILADADMLEQILVILALNARDAMPEGGRLLIMTTAANIPAGTLNNQPGSASGEYLVLEVEDTGRGIPPENLPRIFEPFFTTKGGGRTIGLGLATVFGVVAQHGGWITAESAPASGSRFKVFLPAVQSTLADAVDSVQSARPLRGGETILLVDDEPSIREFTAAVLQEQGYRVLQADSVANALETWKWHAPRIRLLLTDMVLVDQISGLQLAAKLRAGNPGLKVICTSGHQRDTMDRFPELSRGYEFLQKPCRPQTLLTTVRRLLAQEMS